MAFERGVPTEPDRGPVPGLLIAHYGDPARLLPETARARWQALQQRRDDARSLSMPLIDAINELRLEKQRHEGRLRQLTLPRGSGGPGLSSDDVQVAECARRVANLTDSMRRKETLLQDRAARTSNVARLCERIEAWLFGGIPGGTRIVDYDEIDVATILKRNESETQALERLQRRLRELAADEHRVRSAPLPSADAIAKARAEIEQMAARGGPDVDALIEVGGPIRWPQVQQRLDLVGFAISQAGEARLGGMAQGEVTDAMALTVWALKDAVLAKIEAAIMEQSDDAAALTTPQREQQLAQIASDRLEVERSLCALISKLQGDGQAVEFPEDSDVRALLRIDLVTDDRPQGPFGMAAAAYSHIIDVIGPR